MPLQADTESERLRSGLNAPVRIAEPVSKSISFVAVSFCLSLLIHGVVFGAVVRQPADTQAGSGGVELEAIGVEIVPSAILEAQRTAVLPQTAAAPNATIEQTEGSLSEAEQPPRQDQAPPRELLPESRLPALSADPSSVSEAPSVPAEREPTVEQKSDPIVTAQEAQAKGGVHARGLEGVTGQSGAASASPGTIQKYAGEIRNALAKTRLNGRGRRGTTTITFSITGAGLIGAVSVSKSSGDDALDALAIDAIGRTAFPMPPAGMSTAQLTYVIPFHFR